MEGTSKYQQDVIKLHTVFITNLIYLVHYSILLFNSRQLTIVVLLNCLYYVLCYSKIIDSKLIDMNCVYNTIATLSRKLWILLLIFIFYLIFKNTETIIKRLWKSTFKNLN